MAPMSPASQDFMAAARRIAWRAASTLIVATSSSGLGTDFCRTLRLRPMSPSSPQTRAISSLVMR